MPSDLDPYHFFLGIPPKQRPLDHYLLLGVEKFEANAQIIEMAADRQMGHLQRYESGEHGEKVAMLMNDVSRARLCLLDSTKKAAYDQQLRNQLAKQPASPAPVPGAPAANPPPPAKKPADAQAESGSIVPAQAATSNSAHAPQESPMRFVPAKTAGSTPAPPVVRAVKPPRVSSRQAVSNCIGMSFVLLPRGQFVMGSPVTEPERGTNEFMHPVTIGLPFYLAIHPVTQVQYEQVMGVNPSSFSPSGLARSEVAGVDTRNFPVESVSWADANEFCRRLSALPEERSAGRVYRLPTEAEWEYGCRASTPTAFAIGNSLTSQQANFLGSMPYGTTLRGPNLQRPSVAGSYSPNAWGMYDMHGNVWEWCSDLYFPRHDRQLSTSSKRTIRGGSWKAGARACRSASRLGEVPEQRTAQIGFRVVLQAG